jgi:hypothetical protein
VDFDDVADAAAEHYVTDDIDSNRSSGSGSNACFMDDLQRDDLAHAVRGTEEPQTQDDRR